MFASPQALSDWTATNGTFIVESTPEELTQAQIHAHSVADGDFNPAHCQPEFAEYSIFKGRVSHGIATVSRAEAWFLYLVQFERPVETIALGFNSGKYFDPLRPGDWYRYIFEIRSMRRSKNFWKVDCHITCKATTPGKEERLIAKWDWEPAFVENPDIPEEKLKLLRMDAPAHPCETISF